MLLSLSKQELHEILLWNYSNWSYMIPKLSSQDIAMKHNWSILGLKAFHKYLVQWRVTTSCPTKLRLWRMKCHIAVESSLDKGILPLRSTTSISLWMASCVERSATVCLSRTPVSSVLLGPLTSYVHMMFVFFTTGIDLSASCENPSVNTDPTRCFLGLGCSIILCTKSALHFASKFVPQRRLVSLVALSSEYNLVKSGLFVSW